MNGVYLAFYQHSVPNGTKTANRVIISPEEPQTATATARAIMLINSGFILSPVRDEMWVKKDRWQIRSPVRDGIKSLFILEITTNVYLNL